ncbi:MAG: hypothetical protein KAI15_09545, partial [Gammaproteobacteria bacterium]|nr:hypothetical protein [Gammaproteobacteria bacterium]
HGGVAPLCRGQPYASSRLALNKNEHTLNTHFQVSWLWKIAHCNVRAWTVEDVLLFIRWIFDLSI